MCPYKQLMIVFNCLTKRVELEHDLGDEKQLKSTTFGRIPWEPCTHLGACSVGEYSLALGANCEVFVSHWVCYIEDELNYGV